MSQLMETDVGRVSQERMRTAMRVLDGWVESETVPGVAAAVLHQGKLVCSHYVGKACWTNEVRNVDKDTLFLLASVTKPYTALATMLLVEDGLLALDDRLVDVLPEWRHAIGETEDINVWHLLTHTSGLIDGTSNFALRAAQSPLSAWVEAALSEGMEAKPGERFSYCSTGILLLGEIVRRITGVTLPEFLHKRVFERAGLRATFFGAPENVFDRIAEERLWHDSRTSHQGDRPAPWDYNSKWWKQLAVPWSGIYASAEDVAGFGQLFLNSLSARMEKGNVEPVLGQATARLMTRIHTHGIPGSFYGAGQNWGLGWIIRGSGRPFFFGDLASSDAFGHLGYTGTALWIDPCRDLVCAILTNTVTEWRTEYRRFGLFANVVQSAIL